jgi:hypothetical protein
MAKDKTPAQSSWLLGSQSAAGPTAVEKVFSPTEGDQDVAWPPTAAPCWKLLSGKVCIAFGATILVPMIAGYTENAASTD